MSHLPRPSIARTPFGTRVLAVGEIEAMRRSRMVTVMSLSGAPPGVIGRTVTCVIATGPGAGAGAARQLELTNSNAANRRDMVIPLQMMGLRRVEDETGCVARRKETGEGADRPSQAETVETNHECACCSRTVIDHVSTHIWSQLFTASAAGGD